MRIKSKPRVLATDLDGTLIPLEEHAQNRTDLRALESQLAGHQLQLVFVTGRRFESAVEAITQYDLPIPEWILCDVGTSIYQVDSSSPAQSDVSKRFRYSETYHAHLTSRLGEHSTVTLQQRLKSLAAKLSLQTQESEKQSPFKLSYYADALRLTEIHAQLESYLSEHGLPYSIVSSEDPFNGDGLIDFLPKGVHKGHALQWWSSHTAMDDEHIIYAGDSGNDLAAFNSGYQSIVVANADRSVLATCQRHHMSEGWTGRLYAAQRPATSGVLEGLLHFIEDELE